MRSSLASGRAPGLAEMSAALATDLAQDRFLQAATYCSEVECRMSRSRWLRRASRSRAWRYWGLVLVAIMVIGLGGLPVAAYVVMTLLVIVWTLFAAPVWCGAVNMEHGRGVEYCRNNSSGLLLGCWIRQHKFQRFHQAWWTINWRDHRRGMWTGAPTKFAIITGLFGIFAGVIGLMVDLPTLALRL
jgi:hypothetical protein